jgi:hypothetical protein
LAGCHFYVDFWFFPPANLAVAAAAASLDVTTPLQCFVLHGVLDLPAGDKSCMVGFHLPDGGGGGGGGAPVLTVRYLHRGIPHEVTMDAMGPIRLPPLQLPPSAEVL